MAVRSGERSSRRTSSTFKQGASPDTICDRADELMEAKEASPSPILPAVWQDNSHSASALIETLAYCVECNATQVAACNAGSGAAPVRPEF